MSATCGSSLTEQRLEMKPDSFSAILKERLLLPVLVEPADECDVRLQLNGKIFISNESPSHINIDDAALFAYCPSAALLSRRRSSPNHS